MYMSKSIKKTIKGTRKNFERSIEGISRTGKRCKNGYKFDKKTNLCRGKLKISVFNNLGDLQISENGNSISFEPANDKQTIMKIYKEGSLVQQTVMTEKDIRQCTDRGNKKIAKLIKRIERLKNNPKLLQDPKILKRIKHQKYNGGGQHSSDKDSEIHVPVDLLSVINLETSKTDKLKNKIIQLQTELDKITKFQNDNLARDYFNTFIQNYNWWAAGLFGLVLGSLVGSLAGVSGALSLGLLSLFISPIIGWVSLLIGLYITTFVIWIQNGVLDMAGMDFIEYYINYIEVYGMAGWGVPYGQVEMSREMIKVFHEHFDMLQKYNFNRSNITTASQEIQQELEQAKINLVKEMSNK